VISRADMAARGVPRTTLNGWYRERAVNGFPEKAGSIGRTDYWYEDEWTAWHQQHQRARTGALTLIDRGGDPAELVDAGEAARIMGYAGRHVIHSNRRLGYFPEPDASRPSRGGNAPLWKRSTVWAFADSRTGRGGGHPPGTPGAPLKARPYEGDDRVGAVLSLLRSGVEPSSASLAASWGTSQRTAERIIRAARNLFSS
jgi:hypothetical protein